ncbi:MAG: hypothetical protein ABEJ77_07665 [Halanaeroarchaeum sp.]
MRTLSALGLLATIATAALVVETILTVPALAGVPGGMPALALATTLLASAIGAGTLGAGSRSTTYW